MADIYSKERRSWVMARIRGRNTEPEMMIRSMVFRMGFRFRLHDKRLPGCPDIVLPRYKCVIFVNGCFWHGHKHCTRASLPSTHRRFWEKKIFSNAENDRKNRMKLARLGWKHCTVWQCELRKLDVVMRRMGKFLTDGEAE